MRSSSNLYLSRLDHLRFLAALLVLAWHCLHMYIFTGYVPKWGYFPLSLFEEGHTGVALFIVLSGYIFMEICRDKEIVYADFLRNRVLRIAPLFLFWLMLTLWTDPAADALKVLGSLLTMTSPQGQMPSVGWTILVEVQFYLIFPFLLLIYRRNGLQSLFGLIAVAICTRLLVKLTAGPVQPLAYLSMFGRIDQFLLGMIACELSHRYPNLFKSPWLFGGSVVGWLLAYHLYNRAGGFDHAGQSVWVVMPTLEGLAYATWTACWLASPIVLPRWLDDGLAWMGKLSFSFYLNHVLVMTFCYSMFAPLHLLRGSFGNSLAFMLLVVLPVLTLFSALTYYYIELPFLSMRQSYLSEARPENVTPPRLAA